MNRLNQVLTIVVLGLLVFGGFRWLQKTGNVKAPIPGFSVVDPVTAADLKKIANEMSDFTTVARVGEHLYVSRIFCGSRRVLSASHRNGSRIW